MKRFICILLALLITAVSFAEIKWMTKEELKSMEKAWGMTVLAGAYADTEEEVKKICKIDNSINLDFYFYQYVTGDKAARYSKYSIYFIEDGGINIFRTTENSPVVEIYLIQR